MQLLWSRQSALKRSIRRVPTDTETMETVRSLSARLGEKGLPESPTLSARLGEKGLPESPTLSARLGEKGVPESPTGQFHERRPDARSRSRSRQGGPGSRRSWVVDV